MDTDTDDYSSSRGDDEDLFAFVGADVDDSVDPPGLKCELTTYDARYNAKGERIRLAAGKKKAMATNRPRDHDSALVLTRYYDHDKVLDYTLLEIRSPHVKEALRKVIPLYPGVNLHANKVTIRGTPKCLFHYRQELGTYGGTLRDQEAVKHLIFALRYMYDTLRDEVSSYYNLMESPNLESGLPFLNLWMAFRPGDHIYLKSNGVDRVYRFLSMDRCECFIPHCRKSRWTLNLEEIDYDGSDFGHTKVTSYIDPYEGHVPIKYLRAFPLEYHPYKHEIRAAMIARGHKFIALRGVHYLGYDGVAEALSDTRNKTYLGEDDEFPLQSVPVKSRIMVDAKTFTAERPSHRPNFSTQSKPINTKNDDHLRLSDDELMICNHLIPGFALAEKKWCYFHVDQTREVDFNSRAFESLLLPQDQKDMIHSLVNIHSDQRVAFDDVIKGKGKGMIFLLHGVPGVGKTLTAESVADYTKRPLYTVSCGELGVGTNDVEEKLASALELATKWNAIALIDEADVFLEQRSAHDLERNSLVSIFLRTLEYYEGILFLTTNRVGTFDTAFKSRIHLAIKYPSLSAASRRDLWHNFITSTSQNDLSWLDRTCLESLAAEELNGRQIKNIVRTAHALAVSSNNQLGHHHIRKALNAMKMFEADFAEDAAERAMESEDAKASGSQRAKRRRLD